METTHSKKLREFYESVKDSIAHGTEQYYAFWKVIEEMESPSGAALIAAERERQIQEEGYDQEHDENYSAMQLAAAAGCYLASAQNRYLFENTHTGLEETVRHQILADEEDENSWVDAWPWSEASDKRKKHNVIKSLTIAGALIAAEIDRLSNDVPFYCADWNRCGSLCEVQCQACKKTNNL